MNKLLIIGGIVAILIISIVIFSGDKKVETPLNDGPIVVFGDSLVAGVGATKGSDIASLLSARLGVTVINKGISGDTTAGAFARLDTDVISQNPSIVVVIIGGNDFLRRLPKDQTLTNVREIVEKIQASGAHVVLAGIEPLVYNSDYRSIANTYSIEFIPNILTLTRGKRELMSDAIHPNDAGYILFTDAIEEKIRAIQK